MAEDTGPGGAPPRMSLSAAYDEFRQALWYAQEVFHKKGDSGREGVRIACHAVCRFLAVNHDNPQLAIPFATLRAALKDVEPGVTNELFSVRSDDNKRSRSAQKKHLKLWAAVCLEVLVKLKDPLPEASARVARYVSAWPGHGTQIISAKTVQNWRDQLRASSKSERKQFETIRDGILKLKKPRPEVTSILRSGAPGIPKS